jgi:hypothetical protein
MTRYGSYRDSTAFKRSQRLRDDGCPVWPLPPETVGLVAGAEPSAAQDEGRAVRS